MPRKSADRSKQPPEPEESAWYATPEGRRRTQREFTRAAREGKLKRSGGLKIPKTDAKLLEALMEQARRDTTRAISIRLPIGDLERAKEIAARTGVGYQTVLKEAIRDGLKRAG